MDKQEQGVRNKIAIISFGCSLLVIWIHTYNLETYGITQNSIGISYIVYCIEKFWSAITRIAVPMFFLMSGFLFFRSFSWDKLVYKYTRRLKTIVIPYICWCSLYYIYFVIISKIPYIRNVIGEDAVKTLSLVEWLSSLWGQCYYVFWFLKNLIIFIILTPLIHILLKNRDRIPLGTIILLALIFNKYFGWVNMIEGIEMYALGSWLAINYKDLVLYKNRKLTYMGLIYILGLLVTQFKWYNIFFEIILYFSIWFALDIFEYSKDLPWWMQITFFTYVAHDVFLEGFEKVVWIMFGNNPVIALLDYIFMPILVFCFLTLLAFIMKNYFGFVWKILTGDR